MPPDIIISKIVEPEGAPKPPNYRRFWAAVIAASVIYALIVGQDYLRGKWWEHKIPRVVSALDANRNGVSDTDDLIAGARLVVKAKPYYRSVYYQGGGYPPDDEGVCTDLIWRAFKHAGYDLKAMMDKDIRSHVHLYPRVAGQPDPDIDFRRVPNQMVFFRRHGLSLTRELIPGDAENLAQWQPGDIVAFKDPDHVVILSTRRNAHGVPWLIHHSTPYPREADDFPSRLNRGITGHYRFPKQ